jgi:hypothetical protein
MLVGLRGAVSLRKAFSLGKRGPAAQGGKEDWGPYCCEVLLRAGRVQGRHSSAGVLRQRGSYMPRAHA